MDIQQFENRNLNLPSPLEKLRHPLFDEKGIEVYIKRDDLIHPIITGNKWRKLKDYLLKAQKEGSKGIISFGGAYSNHVYSLAFVCHALSIPLELIIRGDELHKDSNAFLNQIHEWGAQMYFVSREDYRTKLLPEVINTDKKLIIPEGGFSTLGIDSVKALGVELSTLQFDEVFLSVGTGTTAIGLAKYLPQFKINGILSLANKSEIEENIASVSEGLPNLKLWDAFLTKKYGKKNTELIEFCTFFVQTFHIQIEPIYTGLMIRSFFTLLQEDYFKPQSKILLIHSGGIKH